MTQSCEKIKVLFVCFGNTCRSPMAEAFFKDLVKKKGIEGKFLIDSAALSSWQVGSDINDYTREILERIGINGFSHEARQISYKDFAEFHYILGMDLFHMKELGSGAEALKSSAKILLLGDFNPNKAEKIILDPICGPRAEFEKCYEQISASCEKFLNEILNKKI